MKKIILFIIQCFFHQSAQWQIQTQGGGGGHPDPEIRGGPGLPKNCFWPFGPHFGQKIGGGGGALPGSATAAIPPQSIIH